MFLGEIHSSEIDILVHNEHNLLSIVNHLFRIVRGFFSVSKVIQHCFKYQLNTKLRQEKQKAVTSNVVDASCFACHIVIVFKSMLFTIRSDKKDSPT